MGNPIMGWNVAEQKFQYFEIDGNTGSVTIVELEHAKKHAGDDYYVMYSVADLGAMGAPDDMITLTWTTPNTAQWEHLVFWAAGTGGWRLRLIEAPTGGAGSQTEQLPLLNSNRNSNNVSAAIALDSTAGEVSYDATLATGGVTLWDQYIPGDFKFAGNVGHDREIVLDQNVKYQLSLYGNNADPATLFMSFYENTNRS